MGFAMNDGTISVHFNDSTSIVLAPGKGYVFTIDTGKEADVTVRHFDMIQPAAQGDLVHGLRRNYPADDYPKELKNKVYLLKHFESYMLNRLYGDQPYTFEDSATTQGMVFISRYLRMKHVILFRLSNDVLQVSKIFYFLRLTGSDEG